MNFPKPPSALLGDIDSPFPRFQRAPDLRDWAFETFIHEGAEIQNPDHEHLKDAEILFVWSSVGFKSKGRSVVGTAQQGRQQGSLGKKELLEFTYREMYGGDLPDFVITLCAPYVAEADPVSVCALVEHELYHCGQEKDEFGSPKFTEDGWPKWTVRGHDIEDFVGVAARYGAYSTELMALQAVLNRPPLVKRSESQSVVCGCGAGV